MEGDLILFNHGRLLGFLTVTETRDLENKEEAVQAPFFFFNLELMLF